MQVLWIVLAVLALAGLLAVAATKLAGKVRQRRGRAPRRERIPTDDFIMLYDAGMAFGRGSQGYGPM